ncbi:MAG: polysaccharide deacetylase [Oscillospiraceae bacterium]|jgi:peptidoglycan/xylan/chitin deacetylase (PgdA/CDA1 family)|nr:polysaccharide deacetylase [Oscillospiraceae bacterium]
MKRFLLFCLCAALLLGGLGFRAEAAPGEVFFAAVDYEVLPLADAGMPYRSAAGVVYAPLSVLTVSATGIFSSQTDTGRLVTLFAPGNKILTFDLDAGLAYDSEKQYAYRAIRLDGRALLPMDAVCSYFNLSYGVLTSEYGPLLRLRVRTQQNTDDNFLYTVKATLADRYQKYVAAHTPDVSTPPSGAPPTPPSAPPPPTPTPAPRIVYLTFDDGPTSGNTDGILDLLDQYGVKATFFVLGTNMRKNEKSIRRMVGSDHVVGLHSYTHQKELFYASSAAMLDELERTNDLLARLTMTRTRLVRVPYGSNPHMTEALCEAMSDAGYRFWDWNLDGDQTSRKTPEAIAAGVISDLQSANQVWPAIILLHDREATVKALPAILQYMTNQNYTFVTCTESERPYNYKKWIK